MQRVVQVVLIVATFAVSWLAMMVLHESGHVLAAWATGGRVVDVELHPWAISRTDVSPNPRPLVVALAGAVVGCVAPIVLWGVVRWTVPRFAYLMRFLVGFCLIANGAYLAGGSFGKIGDAGDLLRLGIEPWQLIICGLLATSAGLTCWNGLGKHFGLGTGTETEKKAMQIDRTTMSVVVFLLVVLAGTMTAWGKPKGDIGVNTPGPAVKRVSLGYLPGGSKLKLEEIPWPQLTHVAHAFLHADEEGGLLPSPGVPNKKLTTAAHRHNVRVLVCLGGGNSVTAFEKITTDPARLKAYVDNVVKLVDENNYDGIDVDWEYPRNAVTKQGFTDLAQSLRVALDELAKKHEGKRKYELTAAISASEYFGRWLDEKALRESFDFLNVMTYDMAGPWSHLAAHHAPLHPSRDDKERHWRSVEAAMNYWSRRRRIPKDKLCIGIPLYGRMFPVSRPFAPLDPAMKEQHRAFTFSQLRKLSREGWTAKWDHDMKAPWLFAPDSKAIVAFDDRNSVHGKATWAREQKYRGMFYWALGQDQMADGKCWLVRAAAKAWPE